MSDESDNEAWQIFDESGDEQSADEESNEEYGEELYEDDESDTEAAAAPAELPEKRKKTVAELSRYKKMARIPGPPPGAVVHGAKFNTLSKWEEKTSLVNPGFSSLAVDRDTIITFWTEFFKSRVENK